VEVKSARVNLRSGLNLRLYIDDVLRDVGKAIKKINAVRPVIGVRGPRHYGGCR